MRLLFVLPALCLSINIFSTPSLILDVTLSPTAGSNTNLAQGIVEDTRSYTYYFSDTTRKQLISEGYFPDNNKQTTSSSPDFYKDILPNEIINLGRHRIFESPLHLSLWLKYYNTDIRQNWTFPGQIMRIEDSKLALILPDKRKVSFAEMIYRFHLKTGLPDFDWTKIDTLNLANYLEIIMSASDHGELPSEIAELIVRSLFRLSEQEISYQPKTALSLDRSVAPSGNKYFLTLVSPEIVDHKLRIVIYKFGKDFMNFLSNVPE
jgi:hypothetical protein